ncbi:hypothetical protein CAC42_5393 [Sphaceloma murrayae]|uniref:F-box domain-containing protein n=1 Tax=Sphaceloma murrayae TaxID=2082308 RepID=A0A2K1QUW5_9PEZI|nr:hypothetical protein CAC42_5393 [Sphaceloma murrayae]
MGTEVSRQDGYRQWTRLDLGLKDYTIEDNKLAPAVYLRSSDRRQPKHDIGLFKMLPDDLFLPLLSDLDLRSYMQLSGTNRAFRRALLKLPQCDLLAQCQPLVLRAIRNVWADRWISLRDLHRRVFTSTCEICGDFGGYLYLLTCTRVCYICIVTQRSLLPVAPAQVTDAYALPKEELSHVPCMHSIVGTYATVKRKVTNSSALFFMDPRAALEVAVRYHGSEEAMLEMMTESVAAGSEEGEAGLKGWLHHDADSLGPSSNPRRFVAIVKMPSIDPGSKKKIEARYCDACLRMDAGYKRPNSWRRQYTREAFSDHLQECGVIVIDPVTGNPKHVDAPVLNKT